MATERFPNDAITTLSGNITDVAASLVVDSATRFPVSPQFRIRLDSELMLVTGVAGTTFTVTRGVEGTTAAAHLDGTVVEGVLTSGGLQGVGALVNPTSAYASRPAAGTEGRLFFPSNGVAIERDSGSLWQPWGPAFPLTAPIASDFTWVNQGTATITSGGGVIHLNAPVESGENYRCLVKAAPATPYTLTAALIPNQLGVNFHMWGIAWRNSGTGTIDSLNIAMVTTQPSCVELGRRQMNSPTSFSAVPTFTDTGNPAPVFLRLRDDGTDRHFMYSRDGQNFLTLVTVTRTNFLTPDQILWYAQPLNATYGLGVTLIHWKEE
jgi:hypothetical protein